MARSINRLTARSVASISEPGLHADGDGLYLRVDQTLNKRWVFVYFWRGRRREMGLGSARTVDLKVARQGAADARVQLASGQDPIGARKATVLGEMTFGVLALRVIADKAEGWRSPKAEAQWAASLKTHAKPIWSMLVPQIDTPDVLECLNPIWFELPETARRVRARIEHVLDVAKVEGLRSGENPARWRGHLQIMLGRQRAARGHHAAMSYEQLPGFMTELRARRAGAALALEFVILTATRTTEVTAARWSEIDGDMWVIPADRMKADREHRVPLSGAAMVVLEKAKPLRTEGDFIFPGEEWCAPLSRMSMLRLVQHRMQVDVTVHGFRSTFKDWASDCTEFDDEVSEQALAHTVGSAVKRAYRRRDALVKRRALMEAWADYCAGKSNVIAFPGAQQS